MNGRVRKITIASVIVGGALAFGVGFAGAQSADDPAPNHKDPTVTFAGDGGTSTGCHHGEDAGANPTDF